MIGLLRKLASLRVTLCGLVLLAVGLFVDQKGWLPGAWVITPPLALLSINLAVALFYSKDYKKALEAAEAAQSSGYKVDSRLIEAIKNELKS